MFGSQVQGGCGDLLQGLANPEAATRLAICRICTHTDSAGPQAIHKKGRRRHSSLSSLMPGGNALLIGVGGSGRHCQTRLASFIAFYKCFSIEITKQQLHCSVIKQLMLVDWCWSIDVDSGHCEQRTRAVVVSHVATRWPPQLCSWQSFFASTRSSFTTEVQA